MKFLLLSLALCLVAGAAVASVDEVASVDDFSTVVTTDVQTKRFKFTWLEQLVDGIKAGGAGSAIPPIEGSVNAIVTGVLGTTKGSLKGLEPSIQAVYVTPVPTLRILLAGSKIKVCGPQTHVEFLLNHIICLVNGPLNMGLGVSPLPICIKGREKQCHGPYMRLPDTLTPQQRQGIKSGDWSGLKDMALQEIDGEGNVIAKLPVEGSTTTTTDGSNPSSELE